MDIQNISGIIEGLGIRREYGKLYVTNPVLSIDCGGLGTPILPEYTAATLPGVFPVAFSR
ncbi:MAG: hypothetical protein ACLQED_04165 [Desulfobaccales bacterium]